MRSFGWACLLVVTLGCLQAQATFHILSCVDHNSPTNSALIERITTTWDIEANSTQVHACAMFTSSRRSDLGLLRSMTARTTRRTLQTTEFYDAADGKHTCLPPFPPPREAFRIYVQDFVDRVVDCQRITL
jgi:hypothetical protein